MLAIYLALFVRPTPVSCVSSNLMPTSGVCKREKVPFDFLDGLRLAADANACSSQASMWVSMLMRTMEASSFPLGMLYFEACSISGRKMAPS